MSNEDIYSDCHREIQNRYGQRALAERTAQAIVHPAFTEQDIAFIGERDVFFLSSVAPDGFPTESGLPRATLTSGQAFPTSTVSV